MTADQGPLARGRTTVRGNQHKPSRSHKVLVSLESVPVDRTCHRDSTRKGIPECWAENRLAAEHHNRRLLESWESWSVNIHKGFKKTYLITGHALMTEVSTLVTVTGIAELVIPNKG